MSLVVQKYGGTSVANLERISAVATRIKATVGEGHQVAVVVSAMAGTTDQLVTWANAAGGGQPDPEEYDVIVATGEQITVGLLALTLQSMQVPACSMLGWQAPVETDGHHARARIVRIAPERIKNALEAGKVVVIPGFQGISPDGRIATLGRGGSDTSAVAVAAALKADRCDIFTDVDGVYTTDPRIVAKAQRLESVTYEEMLEMASLGAKVLQTRSVALAMQHGVHLRVLSSFEEGPGTMVTDESEVLEQKAVSGIAYSRNEAKVTLVGVADRPGVAATVFGPLADAGINVDMIIQSVSADGETTDITFTVPGPDLGRTQSLLDANRDALGFSRLEAAAEMVKVSVIGVGMRSHAGIAHTMFKSLAERGINIQAISTSEIKISVLIDEAYTELALRSLHTAYGLDVT